MAIHVNPDHFKVPYAFGANDVLYQIMNGRPEQSELFCPICRGNVSFVRETDARAAHFRHKDRSDCDALHTHHRQTLHDEVVRASEVLVRGGGIKSVFYWPRQMPAPTGAVRAEQQVTSGEKTYRPDLLVSPKEGEAAPAVEMEVVFSHKPETSRVIAAAKAGRLIGSISIDGLMAGYYQKLWRGQTFDIPEAAKTFVLEQRFNLWDSEHVQREVSGIIRRIYAPATVLMQHAHMRTGGGLTAYGGAVSVGGRRKTWTGQVVSDAEFSRMSKWGKFGPGGRVWNGKTQSWETPDER